MTKDEAKKEHAAALRELLVYGMAGVKLTKEIRRRERLARRNCLAIGSCKCADLIRKK